MASEREAPRKSSRKRKEKKFFGDEESENGIDNIQSYDGNYGGSKIINLNDFSGYIGSVDSIGGDGVARKERKEIVAATRMWKAMEKKWKMEKLSNWKKNCEQKRKLGLGMRK